MASSCQGDGLTSTTVLRLACLHYAQRTEALKLSFECICSIHQTENGSYAMLAPSHTSEDVQARHLDVKAMTSTQMASQLDASHSVAGSLT